jgi:hypothetical protein
MVITPWFVARRPNGRPVLSMNLESLGSNRRDGFRRPAGHVVENVGTARDHHVAAPTQVGSSAGACARANSVGLKSETC